MLHPHVPEELRHFGKHLFATSLERLKTFGLEQWREQCQEARLSRESLHRIEVELRRNREDLARSTGSLRLNGLRFQQDWNLSRIRIGQETLKELDEMLKP